MEYLIGAGLAVLIGLGATLVGFDRDRAFYPTVMVVIALLYGLFAMIGNSLHALAAEALPMVVFLAAAVVGFRRSLWIVAAALAGHGLFDLVHGHWIANPGVPAWWPGFCGAYDVVAAAYLALLLARSRISSAPN
jgi:hypothetical protein